MTGEVKSLGRVCVVGLWHLGCIYAACMAHLGYHVVGVDEKRGIVAGLNNGKSPVFEPGLESLIAKGIADGSLVFSKDIEKAMKEAEYVIIAYDTPVDNNDQVNVSSVLRAAEKLRYARTSATVVISSQVPVGTSERIVSILSKIRRCVEVAYVPENLRLGHAIKLFLKPDMIVVGANRKSTLEKVRKLFAPICTKTIEMDLRSAEMAKHALNAFIATSISFANEIGNICDLVGADAMNVSEVLRSDSRIGSRLPLRPGLGFSGGTLARDLRILQKIGKKHRFQTLLADAVIDINRKQNVSVVDRVESVVGPLRGKCIAVLGLTYKSGTNTLRRSAAIEIIKRLSDKGASVKAFDPQVSKSDVKSEDLLLCKDAYAACKGVDLAMILNDWPGFAELDFERIRNIMKRQIVFDTQNLLDKEMIIRKGLKYFGIGRSNLSSAHNGDIIRARSEGSRS